MVETTKKYRLDQDKAELELLEKSMQEGAEEAPTQSIEEEVEGSPKMETEVIAGQEAEAKQTEDLEYWKKRAMEAEQRYNVSKPKYDTNITKLKNENMTLQKDRIELQKELNKVRQETRESTSERLDKVFTKETVDVLGEKTVEVLKNELRETQELIAKQQKELDDRNIEKRENHLRDEAKEEYGRFYNALTKLVPDVDKLNADPKFLKYLGDVDGAGRVRFEILQGRENIRDAAGVAEFFIDYKKTLKKETPKDSVSKHAGPSGQGSNNIENLGKGDKISIDFVNKFYDDVARRKYVGRHDERLAIEARINKAYESGNIT